MLCRYATRVPQELVNVSLLRARNSYITPTGEGIPGGRRSKANESEQITPENYPQFFLFACKLIARHCSPVRNYVIKAREKMRGGIKRTWGSTCWVGSGVWGAKIYQNFCCVFPQMCRPRTLGKLYGRSGVVSVMFRTFRCRFHSLSRLSNWPLWLLQQSIRIDKELANNLKYNNKRSSRAICNYI